MNDQKFRVEYNYGAIVYIIEGFVSIDELKEEMLKGLSIKSNRNLYHYIEVPDTNTYLIHKLEEEGLEEGKIFVHCSSHESHTGFVVGAHTLNSWIDQKKVI